MILVYVKVKLATVVEVDPKALFSIAFIPRCREGHNSIQKPKEVVNFNR